jgi:hypothetical protein
VSIVAKTFFIFPLQEEGVYDVQSVAASPSKTEAAYHIKLLGDNLKFA